MKKNSFKQPVIESETIESLSAKLLATTAQLMKSNQELTKMQKERNEMLANISHDLRAPITAIRNAVDYLTGGKDLSFEDYESTLKLIDRRTKTLEGLIHDMYYLFCVEDSTKELHYETVEPLAFFEEYFYDALADSRYKDHDLILDMDETLSGMIKIDIQKIVRVLDNLFTNAVKYSPKGSSITLIVHPASDSSQIQITVQDNGIGIPSQDLPHIFGRTYTVSSARTPNSKTGSGLGLSIVKAIVERHEGAVFCESIEGKGSRFSFTLPRISIEKG